MHKHAVVRSQFTTHLAGGLKEWLGFNVTDSTADFRDDHIDIVGSLGTHTRFDFIRDMRNHLHALAQVFTGALFAQHFLINLSRGHIGLLAEEHIKEALIMADVQIGFGTIFSNIDFTMLERVHGAWINVDIWIKFLLQHMDAAAAQQTSEGGCRQTFTKGGDHTTSNENMLGNVLLGIAMFASNHGTSAYHFAVTRRVGTGGITTNMLVT
ncbi:hypothetical protein BIFGAL_02675 [Bifidobacterium gallicum DSM 20093 = LMG 11596]|uniref:Uncharacterized protein n=1 Tax=Bifidobacterium gallicum DSM 20093 = LMG 11596 TaxID=561180 RepID=D1NSB8_9BIFI|nr:hypothetical protein BIFGAL_02675 [Bifidobacterium gallicum DSM 20093 = LMG 11596]